MGQISKIEENDWLGTPEQTVYNTTPSDKPYCGFKPKTPFRITEKEYKQLCRRPFSPTIMRGYIDSGHYVIVDDPADTMKFA